MRTALIAATSLAVACGALGLAAPGSAVPAGPAIAPDGKPHVDPIPSLARLPEVTSTRATVAPRSVPAAANVAKGRWIVMSDGRGRNAATLVQLPPASGVPLMGDWNGDGIDTPGRYDNGQWFVTSASVGKPEWQSQGSFGGEAGDIPVVGNIDTDRTDDIGVYRAGTWLWQRANGQPSPPMSFGVAGDLPVVGDWDGDGTDDIGVVRGTTWYLMVTGTQRASARKFLRKDVGKGVTITRYPSAHKAMLQFSLGGPGDLPVVGDWNRDGRWDPGFVQNRAVWQLSAGLDHVHQLDPRPYKITADETPLVANQATATGRCPTATRNGEAYGSRAAKLVHAPQTPQGTFAIAGNREILATMQDGLRYVMTNDITARLADRVDRTYYDPLSTHKTIEESIRRSANEALAASIALTTSKWTTVNGITAQQLTDFARWHIRSLACEHGALSPGGWGNNWQSALWAVSAGQAGWLLWDELSEQERAYVAAMVVSEAEYASARGPRYFRNRLGVEITPGDSQADEVSWDLMAPALALAMMPTHPSAPKWRNSLIAMGIAAFSRPSDLKTPHYVNGVQVDVRLPGTNANEDGTVTNHGIVNPDYIQNVQHLWWAASMLRSGGQAVPEALFLNADIVYRALAVVKFDSPPYAPPGGTVYQPLGQIYYPMGVSWGNRRPATFVGVDGFANAYAAPDVNAATFLADHARDARALQLRYADGHMYADGRAEESYRLGKEEYALQQMALAWWAGAVKDGTHMEVDTKAYPGVSLGLGDELP